MMYERLSHSETGTFRINTSSMFTNILLADELARESVYHVGDILCEFLGHNFV